MKGQRFLAGFIGLLFGLLIGALFIGMFTSMLNSANAYQDFLREVPGGFIKILAVCALVPAAVFLLIPENWSIRFGLSLAILLIVLVITIIALIISTFGIINSMATFLLIASLIGGGGGTLIIIFFD